MQDILFEYELNPTTWAYLSALLTIGIYFKFNRLFSVRNLDLLGLIFFSPGLLLVFHGRSTQSASLEQFGYAWLFGVGLLFIIRLFLDPLMVRRPKLDPNLSAGGLTFTGIAIMVFLAANVVARQPPQRLEHVLAVDDKSAIDSPGWRFFYYVSSFSNSPSVPVSLPKTEWGRPETHVQYPIARSMILLAHFSVLLGMVLIGYHHFESLQTGMAAAVLYLLSPYLGQMGGRVDHAVPAALLVWAMAAYRRPMVFGFLLGLAGALVFYPLFLLPLGCSFYWQRGLRRYMVGTLLGLAVLVILSAIVAGKPGSPESFAHQLGQMFGATIFRETGVGFWQAYQPAYRIPVLAVFAVLCGSLALWPAQKNFGTLLSCTATVMLASQFCHAFEGGLYMAWYLPLLVLTSFRPNLEDRVALNAVIERRTAWARRVLQRMRSPGSPT